VLLEVADLSTVWGVLDVPEELAGAVKPGLEVLLRFDGGTHEDIPAKVSRVAARVDRQTRTVRVRVDVPNPDQSLKAGLFLRARIQLNSKKGAILLPRDAVQIAEGHSLVFVRTAAGVYEPKTVEVRPAQDQQVAVLAGLDAGADVVTTGAFLLKTEILKDSIGAGCADD
jgi:cobalt-zinc-cadmium efflux system membrane fusion protein